MRTRLREALEDPRGMTHSELAYRLGVSRVAVTNWANGREPIPGGRVRDIERILGLPVGWLEDESSGGGVAHLGVQKPLRAVTMFGWLLANDALSGHLGEWGERVEAAAAKAGVAQADILGYVEGALPLPVLDAEVLVRGLWPGLNPRVVAEDCLDEWEDRDAAVRGLLRDLAADEGLLTFDDVIRAVQGLRDSYRTPAEALDDGREIPALLVGAAAALYGGAGQ